MNVAVFLQTETAAYETRQTKPLAIKRLFIRIIASKIIFYRLYHK